MHIKPVKHYESRAGLLLFVCVGHDFQIWMSDSEGSPSLAKVYVMYLQVREKML